MKPRTTPTTTIAMKEVLTPLPNPPLALATTVVQRKKSARRVK
jgi:hypothetical protein